MQNPQMAAQMAAMTVGNGPVDGTPMMGSQQAVRNPREQLNTYIYDYFMQNHHYGVARAMLEDPENVKMMTLPAQRPSPNNRANGVDPMDEASSMPRANVPQNRAADNTFLLDWWMQFWDIWEATKSRAGTGNGGKYVQHTRNLASLQNDQRNQRMMMNNTMNAQYQIMRNGMPNGVAPNDLKRAAAMNNRPNGNAMANMGQMKNQAMMAAQMQRDGSTMDMNGQRPQSPGASENAPSPNKRARMEGGMNGGMNGMNGGVQGNQFEGFVPPGQNAQQKNIEGMTAGVQNSPMPHPGLDGQENMFSGNGPRPGMPANAPGAPQGNHALQDYQMQLMLLEQQNKRRLLMARQEQDSIPGPHQGPGGTQGFPAAMSPQGGRPGGPSPNPADQMKPRGTPKMSQSGSPLPEGSMPQRGSPAPNMNFDPSLAPPGMPPQFYPQIPQQSPMMRPPSSHPVANLNGQALTQQQMEAMRNGQMAPNGVWRGPQQPGMMPGQQPMGGPIGNNPQQRPMPPPPAPTNDVPRPEPSPSQSNQAPPTPSQPTKGNPKKKPTKDNNNKKPANKKGANAGTTPAASAGEEPPTPTSSTPVAPITPHSKQSFNHQNGQSHQPVQPQQVQQQPMDNNVPPFGNLESEQSTFDLGLNFEEGGLENFDFDSFLQNPNDNDGFALGNDFTFDPDVPVEL